MMIKKEGSIITEKRRKALPNRNEVPFSPLGCLGFPYFLFPRFEMDEGAAEDVEAK